MKKIHVVCDRCGLDHTYTNVQPEHFTMQISGTLTFYSDIHMCQECLHQFNEWMKYFKK